MRFHVGDGIGGRAERPRSKCCAIGSATLHLAPSSPLGSKPAFRAFIAIICQEDVRGPCAAKLQESKLPGTRSDLPVNACLVTLSAVNDIVRREYGNSLQPPPN